MKQEVKRNYLEIYSLEDLNKRSKPSDDYSLNLLDPINFQLNKFFYKNIGNKHKWVDRLIWSEEQWIDYVSSSKVKTYILKNKDDLVGFFELIFHLENKEVEIAYFGILAEYQNKKWPKLSKLVGWNCIQRRNFAILEAYDRGAQIIALIDDDNIPYKNWFKGMLLDKRISSKLISINKKVFDPVGFTNHKNLWHRGYPLELINGRKYKKLEQK